MYAHRLRLMEVLERKFAPLERYHMDVVGLCEDARGEIAFLKKKLDRVDPAAGSILQRQSKREEVDEHTRGDDGIHEQDDQPVKGGQGQLKTEHAGESDAIHEQDDQLVEGAHGEPKKMEARSHEMEANGIDVQDHQPVEGVNEQPKPEKIANTDPDSKSGLTPRRPKPSEPQPTTQSTRNTFLSSLFRRRDKDMAPARLLLLRRTRIPQPPSSPTKPQPPTPRRRLAKAHRHPKAQEKGKSIPEERNQDITAAKGRDGDNPSNDVIPDVHWRDIGTAADLPVEKAKGKGRDSDTESL
ncbi:MAG: hypothetical protein Q9188_002104, partial [Gyalolechia gomerana]